MVKKTVELPLALLILVLAFELAFVKSIAVNSLVVVVIVLFFAYKKQFRALVALLLVPLLPALANYWSFYLHATDASVALVYFIRTYAYAALGFALAFGVDSEEVLLVLEQKGLPANFVYGLLVVVHAIPAIKDEVDAMVKSSILRGKKLYLWSPMLYVKAIMTSFLWSKQYTIAMKAHGYQEHQLRTHYLTYQTPLSSKLWITALLLLFQGAIYYC